MRWRELRRCPSCGRKTYIIVTPDGLIPCIDCARWFSESRVGPRRRSIPVRPDEHDASLAEGSSDAGAAE